MTDELSGVPRTAGAAAWRRAVPPPALCGFLLLLALLFTVSYAVGAASGPVSPGMHRDGTGGSHTSPGDDGDGDHMDGTHG